MPTLETIRHKLPLLAVSQAQKEITHNEALARVDALLFPVVQDELAGPPAVTDQDFGKCWLIAGSASGEWVGKSGQIAIWAGGSWRYNPPCEGMRIRQLANQMERVYINGQWVAPPLIADPANGALVDIEARVALSTLLTHLRILGIVAI